jgi:hypothetical protein
LLVAPFGTRQLFANASRLHVIAHGAAWICAAIGLFAAPLFTIGWLVFTVGSALVFLRARVSTLFTPTTLAAGVPFVFSNIAALWLVGGSNNLHLLGYGPEYSYYAALHGNVLGWIVLGALAILVDRSHERRVYVASMFVCLVSFLLIAFGIDKLRALKPFGIAGLSIALTASLLVFLRTAWSRNRTAFAIGCISAAGLAFTMALAWRNELVTPIFVGVLGVRGMVSVHGVLNALVVGPCFLWAVVMTLSSGATRPS